MTVHFPELKIMAINTRHDPLPGHSGHMIPFLGKTYFFVVIIAPTTHVQLKSIQAAHSSTKAGQSSESVLLMMENLTDT